MTENVQVHWHEHAVSREEREKPTAKPRVRGLVYRA